MDPPNLNISGAPCTAPWCACGHHRRHPSCVKILQKKRNSRLMEKMFRSDNPKGGEMQDFGTINRMYSLIPPFLYLTKNPPTSCGMGALRCHRGREFGMEVPSLRKPKVFLVWIFWEDFWEKLIEGVNRILGFWLSMVVSYQEMVDFPAQSFVSFRVAVNKNPTFSREKAPRKIHHRLQVCAG